MAVRVAINGLGRIGRSVLRNGFSHDDLDFVAVNDLADPATLTHLLAHDSLHGPLKTEVKAHHDRIFIDGKEIRVFGEREPDRLPWKDLGVDVVLEATGRFLRRDEAARHISAGAGRVVLSAPGFAPDVTLILGINEEIYDRARHRVISMASCTANCLAPIAAILDREFGIEQGFMTTVHGYTNDHVLHDSPHRDLRRARAAALNIIPTRTTAIGAMGEAMPSLKGKIEGIAVRVPTPNVAVVDFVATLSRPATAEELNRRFVAWSEGPMRGILACSEEPLVSCDLNGNPYSSIIDLSSTCVMGGTMVKVLAWYDNESGFSHRLCELFPLLAP